jgi:hypothetical protein
MQRRRGKSTNNPPQKRPVNKSSSNDERDVKKPKPTPKPTKLGEALKRAAISPVMWAPHGVARPIAPKWPQLGTQDPEVIKQWSNQGAPYTTKAGKEVLIKNPNFCQLLGNGVLVLDVDYDFSDQKVLDNLQRDLEKQGLTLPTTLAQFTPQKRAHFFYSYDPSLYTIKGICWDKEKKTGVFPGVDIRAQGNQVPCPLSFRDDEKDKTGKVIKKGGLYTPMPMHDGPVVPLPESWYPRFVDCGALVDKSGKVTGTGRAVRRRKVPPLNDMSAIETPRNRTHFDAARSLYAAGFSNEEVRAIELTRNAKSPDPLDEDELLKAVDSAQDYATKRLDLDESVLAGIDAEVAMIRYPQMVVVYPNGPQNESDEHKIVSVESFTSTLYANRTRWMPNPANNVPMPRNGAADWVKWKKRTEYQQICYEPDRSKVASKELNIWQGMGMVLAPAEKSPKVPVENSPVVPV